MFDTCGTALLGIGTEAVGSGTPDSTLRAGSSARAPSSRCSNARPTDAPGQLQDDLPSTAGQAVRALTLPDIPVPDIPLPDIPVPDMDERAMDERAMDWAGLPPGPVLAAALNSVVPSRLELADRIDLLRAWTRLESWVAAGKIRAMTEVAALGVVDMPADDPGSPPLDGGAELVATALRISPRAAQSQIGWARVLTASCPATFALLATGAICPQAARVICEETTALDDRLVARIEERVLGTAPGQTPQQLRRSVRRAIAALAPRELIDRCEREVAGRSVTLTPASFGMAFLEAYLPAPEAQALYGVLTETAYAAKDRDLRASRQAGLVTGDTRGTTGDAVTVESTALAPLDAYRADALIRLGTHGARELADSGMDPARWQAQIVIDLPTALGLADNPAELRGYGSIAGPLARILAAEAPWRRWISEDRSGRLIDVGRRRYIPSPALRQFIQARDQRCRFPGCEQPAHRCDLDHATPWDNAGETTRANLGALCRRHHRLKTHCDWQIIESRPDGSCTWRTPSDEIIRVEPEPVLAKTTLAPALAPG